MKLNLKKCNNGIFIAVPLLIFVVVNGFLFFNSQVIDDSFINKLKVPPAANSLYFLGNSMFKTGIEFRELENFVHTNKKILFSYHDGHYSNLWYLIAKNGISEMKKKPSLVVWGFRPTYAIMPAFRKKEVCDIEKFYGEDEKLYELINKGEKIQKHQFHSQAILSDYIYLYGNRQRIREQLQKWQREIGLFTLISLMKDEKSKLLRAELIQNNIQLSDLVLRQLSKGKFLMMEEQVVDRGRGFVKGPLVNFGASFIPHIYSVLESAGVKQLILIFKPRKFLDQGRAKQHTLTFVSEASTFFREHDVPYIDFTQDDAIQKKHYAKGDHYNEEGRLLVTKRIGNKINGLYETRYISD